MILKSFTLENKKYLYVLKAEPENHNPDPEAQKGHIINSVVLDLGLKFTATEPLLSATIVAPCSTDFSSRVFSVKVCTMHYAYVIFC